MDKNPDGCPKKAAHNIVQFRCTPQLYKDVSGIAKKHAENKADWWKSACRILVKFYKKGVTLAHLEVYFEDIVKLIKKDKDG